ncbi:Putative peptidoglycan binding domain-containing protein [Loktanella atrilutea]|uniref:Putative peptidoglycan binding domain-containing protein n=1 Tax=Loktanella atrilutea TaxID=366533 RepID=A0A1M5C945_LOKAT|nr:peptidoglycan-binding domain-containing protein [Loktanella atrilutea]SHF51190.1 Putative peptidoglycan binding domain-containing protein [Loktanella atrilutea]
MRQLLLSTVMICAASLAQAEDAALIVGIADYDTLRDVRGAGRVTDAVPSLQRLGFSVYGTGGSGDVQVQANAFSDAAANADRLVAVLTGQFVTDGQRTWLMPANAASPKPFTVANGAISVETVLATLEQTPGAAVLVLGHDERSDENLGDGLSRGIGDLDVPSGVTVVEGSVAAASDLLSDVIATPGGDVIAGVRGSRDLTGSGFMPASLVLIKSDARPSTPPPAVSTPPVASVPNGSAEATVWEQARAADDQAAYTRYLDRYPDGPHASAAVERLRELRDPNLAYRKVEDALNLPLEARRAIQRDLQVLGYDTRGIDGIFGPGSRGAIKQWQAANSMSETGFLSAEQIGLIDTQANTRSIKLEAEAKARRETELRADRAYWAQTGVSGKRRDLRDYLERYPDGLYAKQAQEAIAAFRARDRAAAASADNEAWDKAVKRNDIAGYRRYLSDQPEGAFREEATSRVTALNRADDNKAQTEAAQAGERALALDPISLRLVEARLSQLGLDPGTVDGNIDSDTRGAIRRYQRDRQINATGYLDQATVSQMLTDAFR